MKLTDSRLHRMVALREPGHRDPDAIRRLTKIEENVRFLLDAVDESATVAGDGLVGAAQELREVKARVKVLENRVQEIMDAQGKRSDSGTFRVRYDAAQDAEFPKDGDAE